MRVSFFQLWSGRRTTVAGQAIYSYSPLKRAFPDFGQCSDSKSSSDITIRRILWHYPEYNVRMAALAESLEFDHLSLAGLPSPMTLRLAVPLSDKELIAFSHRNRPYRIELNANGELEIMSPVGFEGGQRELFVMRKLGDWADIHGGKCASSNAGFRLSDESVRSPDASWVSDARIDRLTVAEKRGFAPVCPDFLVEILSESDSRKTLEAKMEMWIANGTKLAWMIDPFAADITIYQPAAAPGRVVRPDWIEAETIVPGFRLDTARLWAK